MRKLIPALLISVLLLLALRLLIASPSAAQEPPHPPAKGPEPTPSVQTSSPPHLSTYSPLLPKIEPQLLKKVLESGDQPVPFIVYLKATANLSAAIATAAPGLSSQGEVNPPVARRTAIVAALQQIAQASQAGVLQTLNTLPPASGLSQQGQAGPSTTDIRPLWIVNAVAAKGSLDMILALAARPDVEIIRLDKEVKLEDWKNGGMEKSNSSSNLPTLQSSEWGIAKIRADLVHNALGINGTGVVVANIDSGVDWQHPALQSQYRGYTGPGKLPQHLGNWFDATAQGATYPVDGNGHGTHTMGTIAGGNGVGVAPGARWIAARAFDSSGSAQNSWLHNAFQWILAPNGNPALAPDLVNNSWSNSAGASIEFQPDIQALLSAGIYPVFSAGNDGPDAGTIGSPGSLDIALAVGATDINDEMALFSGRGPSPWHKIKPEVTAPGKEVRSSLPGGAYGTLSGTSMAAPHVVGVIALMLQASPDLTSNLNSLSYAITSTAVRLGSPIPNNDYGWGRVDAYNAVMSVGSFGTMQGQVIRANSTMPIGNALLQITPHNGNPGINTTTKADGTYLQGLAANTYDVTVSAFGYLPTTTFGLNVTNHAATVQNFTLSPKPTGALTGIIREAGSNLPLIATLSIEGAPVQISSNSGGSYTLTLPEGIYTATVVAAAHRITRAVNLVINDGGTTVQDFWLPPAPKILLVDSGRWYQESEIGYYQQALTDLLYPYDTWQITQPFTTPNDVPVTSTLTAYDIVIWSAPLDSPGYVGADAALAGYLQTGRKLLLSGQDVAYFDGGGSLFGIAEYFRKYLKAGFLQENNEVFTVTGVSDSPFAGLSLDLKGGDGANNQAGMDVITNTNSDFAGNLLTYGSGEELAGLHVGLCVPYRAIFLPFGFESINNRADRGQVLGRAIDWLVQSPAQTGVELTPTEAALVGNFDTVVSHTIRVRNTGTGNDTINLSLSSGVPYSWPINPVPPPSLALTSCQSQTITIGVRVNVANSWHVSTTHLLTAQSTTNPATTDTVTRTTKSPAPVLLVDDDRFYSFAAQFKEALAANQIPYDYWLVPKSWSGLTPPSPPLEILQMYPLTVWYTAYDWYQPLATSEEERLAAYLNGGGRLMFSGQDYIYNLPDRKSSPFARDYLGVLAHIEDYSSTLIAGQPGNLVGAGLGPYPLTFPPGYTNWTDALTPTSTAQVATRGQAGQPNSLTNNGIGPGSQAWHTHFLAFGPELLSSTDRARLMQRSLGWLSWLGRSTVTPDVSASLDGTAITFTARLVNDGWIDLPTTVFTATFPTQLTPASFSAELTPLDGNLVWNGPLPRNQPKVLTYTAHLADSLPLGTIIRQTSWLAYPDHHLLFDRVAEMRVNFPDLSNSTLSITPLFDVNKGDTLNYTLVLKNTGPVDDPIVTATTTLPHMLELAGVDQPSQGTLVTGGKSFTWTTALASNAVATLTYRAVISYETSSAIQNTVYVNDGLNDPFTLTASTSFKVRPLYLPIIFKK